MKLSIVIPVYNEADNIRMLYHELKDVLEKMGKSYEVLFIDDGSSDNTISFLKDIQRHDEHIKLICFRRNFGQTAAISAGFDHAVGDIIVTMDGDLQNDPRDIPRMIHKIEEEGFDLVTGWRYDRKDPFISRKLPSIIANKIISMTTRVCLHDYGCTLKAFKKEIIKNIRLYGEMHRFIPAVASGMGIRFDEIKVNHRPRQHGTSKYGISRTIRVILDLITVKFLLSYATRPIQVFGFVGMVSFLTGGLICLVMAVQRQFYGVPMADRPMLLLAILIIFIGTQFISIGLVAELQARTYHESQNKPVYYVREIVASKPRTDKSE